MNCIDCKHCGDIVAGSSHHRSCNALSLNQGLKIAIGMTPYIENEHGDRMVLIKLNPHGIKNGWCTYPINFDPIWIDECLMFDNKIKEDENI